MKRKGEEEGLKGATGDDRKEGAGSKARSKRGLGDGSDLSRPDECESLVGARKVEDEEIEIRESDAGVRGARSRG